MKLTPIHFCITLFFLALFLNCKTNSLAAKSISRNKTQLKIERLVTENDIPGLNFSIIKKNSFQENYSFGFSDKERNEFLKKDHVLFSGSIGKTYAVALLLNQVDVGKIELNKLFLDYFQEEKWLLQIPNIENITVEMLLQHTSGLPRWVMKPEVWETLNKEPNKVWSYQDRLSHVFNEKPIHEVNKGWSYSDTNYILLGMLIEQILKENYYKTIRSKILAPYNLSQTFPTNKRYIPNLATGYSKLPEFFKIPNKVVSDNKYILNPQMEWTGGGMASTTSDLAKWCKIYFEGNLFSEELLKKVTTVNSNGNKVLGKHSYGMGSFIYQTKNGTAYGHSGFMPGYSSIIAYYPELKIAVALQINCDYATSKTKLVEYLDQILASYL